MDLSEVLKTYLGGDQQGQLVIKFVGEDHLCKVSVENGQAIYLTLGTLGPTETLDAIVGKVAEWTNFIKGLPARKRLDKPLDKLLLNIAGVAPLAEGEVALTATSESEVAALPEIVAEGAMVDATQINDAINRFTDLVGPLASILIEKICSNLVYTAGTPMSAAIYTRFIVALATEIPEGDRQSFIDAVTQ